MYRCAPMSSRNQIGFYLTDRGLTSIAVEVGTHRGEYALILLNNWPGILHCVDPWSIPPSYEQQASKLAGGGVDREADYQHCETMLAPCRQRVWLHRDTSAGAVGRFADSTLDLVYIDGDHGEQAIKFDLCAWWTKVRPGGLLAGHDIVCPGELSGGWGKYIEPVVHDFSKQHGVDVWLVVEEGGLPWSYYMIKPSV